MREIEWEQKTVLLPCHVWLRVVPKGTPNEPVTWPKADDRPPFIAEVASYAKGAAATELQCFPSMALGTEQAAHEWRDAHPGWFKDALSVHLVKIDKS
ncbi:hypothetical protein [Pelomonas sp. Root1237]|uniref:hypothetical protein n=1 Tax=Pelomonas sp. Root1237 TaxID=1736434 RepID=UPI0007159EC6|nr:hypothetical protein [Pelomonas sp. Root1237]KQV85962.1 hypothetical protein ASC91_22550 [Pelomonas sp. Root1237]